jgi:hypothetical protein
LKTETVVLQEGQKSTSPPSTREGGERAAGDPVLLARVIEWYLAAVPPAFSLKFINKARAQLEIRQMELDRTMRLVPVFKRSRFYDWLLTVEYHRTIQQQLPTYKSISDRLPAHLRRVRLPASASLYIRLYRTRHVVYGVGVVVGALLLFIGYLLVSWSARHLNTYLAQRYQRYRAPIVVTLAGQANQAAGTPGARFLPGYKPEQVWQVESTAEFERYSNGARILKRYETDNHPRGYYLIPRGAEAVGDQLRREIAGIVYHTSESDILPFVSENNQSIKYRSQGLLEYVRRNKSYNYLIDRYGEVYRIVRDDHAAFHAGHSIWGDERYNYVGLNESFIGICFESTSTAGSLEETLTEAQIVSGRALTNVLRSRYNIEDVNCTTHGLVSINPDKMLVAFHYDWVRNFPFEAMGLSDKYKVAPPNMLDYGFTYDEETLEKLKNVLWPGAVEAEQEFRRRVERSKMGAEPLRQRLRDRYLAQLNRGRQLRPPDGDGEADGSTAETRR